MSKISFKCDYSEGCHPNILKRLADTNLEQQNGYGEDEYSNEAKNLIRSAIGNKNADIHFVSGGTQANTLAIASALKPFESVISASTGHINVHEAGAIEATGHKIESVISKDGKLSVSDIQQVLNSFEDHHMVRSRMVYVSNPTELGTLYSKKDLEDVSNICRKNNLYLFLDGARLGSALTAKENDLSLVDIANLTDAFYIGGTKNGALLGEAIVIVNDELKKDFLFHVKQRGALLAKGQLIGIQFLELFNDNLYFDLAKHANEMAGKLSDVFKSKGYSFLVESLTNQIFPILPNTLIQKLSEKYDFYVWKKIDENNSAIRLVTSWATLEASVVSFIADLAQ
jgi:threonine aldolase